MRVLQSSVNDVTNLPNQCKHGYIVKIANSRMSEEDDYYLRFDGEMIEMDLALGLSVQNPVYLRLLLTCHWLYKVQLQLHLLSATVYCISLLMLIE